MRRASSHFVSNSASPVRLSGLRFFVTSQSVKAVSTKMPIWSMNHYAGFGFSLAAAVASFTYYQSIIGRDASVVSSLGVEKGTNTRDPFGFYPGLPEAISEDDEAIDLAEANLSEEISSPPSMFELRDVLTWADTNTRQSPSSTGVGYYILAECDALVVPGVSCMKNSVRQVASQFNSAESPNKDALVHPREYQYDRTQGPAEQSTSFLAALSRWVYKDHCDGMNILKTYPIFDTYFDYQNGYLTPRLGKEQAAFSFLLFHVGQIKINVQRVGIDGADHAAIQVLNSTVALGAYDKDAQQRTILGAYFNKKISELLITQQYQAVASVAVREAKNNPNIRIPVCLTLIGAGAFQNDEGAVKSGIAAACNLIARSGVNNIDVCLSIYNSCEIDTYKTKHFDAAPIIDEETLIELPHLSAYETVLSNAPRNGMQ